jgi:hypothetical protein
MRRGELIVCTLVLLSCSKPTECPQCIEPEAYFPKNTCTHGSGTVSVDAVVTTQITAKPGFNHAPRTQKIFWRFSCHDGDASCDAARAWFDTDKDGRSTISFWPVANVQVTADSGEVAVVTAGPWKTFTIDFVQKQIRYSERAEEVNIVAPVINCGEQ